VLSPSAARFTLARVPRLAWETERRDPVAIVTLQGELDLQSSAVLELELDLLVAEEGVETVVLDLRALEFLDSSGLRLALVAEQRLRAAGRALVLVRGAQVVQRVFELTRMTERLTFVDAPEDV
jgi:anti-anti-sigma factor